MLVDALLGGSVLALLSVFFAYVIAPAVAAIRRRVKVGPRRRPVHTGVAILLLYAVLFVPGAVAWRSSEGPISQWVHVTAPAAIDHLFRVHDLRQLDRLLTRVHVPHESRLRADQAARTAVGYVEREAKGTMADLLKAARYAYWLAVAPVLAFLLLTAAPGFQRSALRVLPRGHLQWRGEEYLRDVNSALAGYVRAQALAGLIVGALAVTGFVAIGVPSAVSKGVASGVLELAPAIGPFIALLIAAAGAGDRTLAVVAFFIALRVLQDYVVYPRLIRHGMHLSTPAVILTIWIGAALAGAAGVVIAIPVAGLLSVSVRHWREYRSIERLVRAADRAAKRAPASEEAT